ncbi:MAG: CHASE domain-containing protein [Bdellovibrionota bacterium]
MITIFAIVLASWLFWYSTHNLIAQENQRLEHEALKVQNIIEDYFKTFIYGLQGTRGVLITDDFQFDYRKFRAYAESRDLFNNFKGALGFGFIRYLKENEAKKDPGMIVELFEPAELSSFPIGSDISIDSDSRDAAILSAKTGEVVITKKLTLNHNENNYSGFLFLLPVYKTTKLLKSEQERFRNLLGWVYTPLILDDLVEVIKLKMPPDLDVSLEIDKNMSRISFGNLKETSLFFANTKSTDIFVGSRTWKLEVSDTSNKILSSLLKLIVTFGLGILTILFGGCLLHLNILGKDRSLVEKTNLLNSVINSASHAVISTDPEGIIKIFNSAAERMLNYSAKEVVGIHTLSLIHDSKEIQKRAEILTKELGRQVNPGFDAFVAKSLVSGSDTNEWTYIKKNGEAFPVRLCMTPIYNAQNVLIGFLSIAEDLTEQKNLISTIETQRIRMQAAAKMSLLGEMASGIAHKINTPLATIYGLANLLNEKNEGGTNTKEESRDKLHRIETTTERIAKIVKGLRLFSRNSEGDSKEITSINSIIESTVALCNEKMISECITLQIDVDKSLSVYAKEAELSQVLLNLVSNAADAIFNEKNKWIKIESYQKEASVIIAITDCGGGITKSVAERMMNPFFTTKEVGKGTGLGLSISKNIVESHEGTLEYDSSSLNTRFVITLPSGDFSKSNKHTATNSYT